MGLGRYASKNVKHNLHKASFAVITAAVLVAVIMCCIFLFGCTPLKYNTVYKRYMYDGNQSKFIQRAGSIEFFDGQAFAEYFQGTSKLYDITGKYYYEGKSKSIFGSFDSFRLSAVKSQYQKELAEELFKTGEYGTGNSGVRKAETAAKELVASIITEPVYQVSGEYIFKYGAITAARAGAYDENLASHNGFYNLRTSSASTAYSTVKFENGKVYSKRRHNSEDIYDVEAGIFSVKGDFLTLYPTDGSVAEQKYLYTTITLPEFTDDDINDVVNGIFDSGVVLPDLNFDDMSEDDVRTALRSISLKKIRVLVLDFYTISPKI